MRNDERGISEVLGYALVFGLVISTVAVVTVAGFSELQDTRDTEQLNNAQRAFDLLATNMNDITRRGAPSRATEIRLAEAQLEIASRSTFEFRGTNSTTSDNFSVTTDVKPIVYRSSDTDSLIAYSAGAVFRRQDGTTAPVRDPNFVITNETMVVPLIETRGPTQGIGGGTARVRADRPFARSAWVSTIASNETGFYDTVWMNVTSPRAGAWQDLLTDYNGFDSCALNASADTVSCEASPEEVHIVRIPIDIDLEN